MDGTKILKETWGNNVLIPLYDNEDSICGIEYNGSAYWFYKNLQGDIISIANSDGDVIAKYTYDAWGKVCSIIDTDGNAITDSTNIAIINPYRYRGYYYDTEIGMYYLQSRYYDPAVGRFVNADIPRLCITSTNSIESNLFVYCYNNPTEDIDVSGRFGLLFAMGLGALCGAAVQYLLDVLANIIDGKKNIFAIRSTVWDYICAAVSGSLAATGIGKMAAVIWSVIISTVNYVGNVISGKSKFNIWDLIFSVVVGGICGFIGGSGTNLKRISGVVKTSKSVLKTAVSPKKIAMYTAKLRNSIKSAAVGAIRYFFSSLAGRLSWPLRDQVKKWA